MSFQYSLTVNNHSIKKSHDWIRTADLWCWKRLLYQLSHNHCQKCFVVPSIALLKCFIILYSFAETRVNMSGTIESGGFVPDFPSPHSRRSFRTLPHNFHQHQRPSSSSFAPDRLLTYIYQDNTNLRGRITVQLTFILFSFETAALLKLNEQQFYMFGQIQTSQAAGQPYCDTSLCGE